MRRSPDIRNVLRAAGLSLAVHATLLATFSLRVGRLTPDEVNVVPVSIALEAAEAEGLLLDQLGAAVVAEADRQAAPVEDPPAPPPPAAPPPPPAGLPRGDVDRLVERETAPRRGVTAEPGIAAPDSGDAAGKPVPAAFRRDSSTLHARLADGAELYQRSRERTARRASSPQPIRQERVVGMRDSSRTERPRPPAALAPPPTSPPEAEGALDPEVDLTAPDQLPPSDPGAGQARGDGPLDTEQGPRRFDVAVEGPARDTHDSRAASDESHPGRMDLSSPSASGPADGATGRGPAETPGAVSHQSAGRAPAIHGAAAQVERGPLALSTAEREYLRYLAEIRRRVASALRFPKRLALLLEQGETVVHFVVRADGRLAGGVQVVKSAGFDEFDAEAVRAVTQAAPFPRTGRVLNVSMPIAFDNPVVR